MKKIIYESVQINKELLSETYDYTQSTAPYADSFKEFYSGSGFKTCPKGTIVGIKFISYVDKTTNTDVFLLSNTKISITDTRSIPVTDPTDIRDYEHNNGNYLDSFKKVDYKIDSNEKITVDFETTGQRFPICGEFVFAIEEDCECPIND